MRPSFSSIRGIRRLQSRQVCGGGCRVFRVAGRRSPGFAHPLLSTKCLCVNEICHRLTLGDGYYGRFFGWKWLMNVQIVERR